MWIYKHFTICICAAVVIFCTTAHAKPFEHQREIDALYERNGGQPLWVDGNTLSNNGKILYETLQNAWQNGLNPASYNIDLIKNQEPLQAEILLTQGYIKYIRDLSGMRINAQEVGLRAQQWTQPISAHQALQKLEENAKPLEIFLKQQEPQTQTYQALKQEMIRLHNSSQIPKQLQIALNMERLRWLPKDNPEKFIIVNIPAARLWAVANGKAQFEMPVIVGRTDRPTKSFITNITGVRFNPTWTIPPTIKEKDIWPKLKEDNAYLTDKGIELFDGDLTIDPTAIDWREIPRSDLSHLRMLQGPGPTNPLGRIRILMPNEYSIFLHDTPSHEPFSAAIRSYSSGCVRMQSPEKVAGFILDNQKNLKKYYGGKPKDILIKNKIPIYLVYHTIWIGDGKKVIYGKDIYDYDKKLLEIIKNNNGIPDF